MKDVIKYKGISGFLFSFVFVCFMQVFLYILCYINWNYYADSIIAVGLYSGLGATLVGVVPYMGINFSAYEYLKRYFSRNVTGVHTLVPIASHSVICGALSGSISKFIVYPLDTIKRKLQSQVLKNTFDAESPFHRSSSNYGSDFYQYSNIKQTASLIVSKEGVRGLYRVGSV